MAGHRHADRARKLTHLEFVQVGERLNRGGIVAELGRVTQECFGLVRCANHESAKVFRLIVEHNHPLARHHIPASSSIVTGELREVRLDHRRDFDLARRNAQRLRDEFTVRATRWIARAVRH